MSSTSPNRIKFNPCLARYKQYYWLLATSIMAQLPYPYLSKNAALLRALLGVKAFTSFLVPYTVSLKVVYSPTSIQKSTNPLSYVFVSNGIEGSLGPTFCQND